MIAAIHKILIQIFSENQPKSILCVGNNVQDGLRELNVIPTQCRVCEVTVSQIYSGHTDLGALIGWHSRNDIFDFCVVANALEYLDKNDATHLLAHLRDLYTKRLIVVVPVGNQWVNHISLWQESDLLALGFIAKAKLRVKQKPVCVYTYDINTYKTTPDWLNNKFWANPELWGKYWW